MDKNNGIVEKYLRTIDMSVSNGDRVHKFTGANMSLGDMLLRFDRREEFDRVAVESSRRLKICMEVGFEIGYIIWNEQSAVHRSVVAA